MTMQPTLAGTRTARLSIMKIETGEFDSPKRRAKPGPKGPNLDVIRAVVDMKQRNPTWGCPRIAEQITLAFGIPINKDVVRRILAAALPNGVGWWWSVLAHVLGPYEDSLWSADLTHLRCEYVA